MSFIEDATMTDKENTRPEESNSVLHAINAGQRIGTLEKELEFEKDSVRVVDVQGIPHLLKPTSLSIQPLEEFLERPAFLKENRCFLEADSFCAYVNEFKDGNTRIYVDSGKHSDSIMDLEAIFDDHERPNPGDGEDACPRWGRHKACLRLEVSPELRRWNENSGMRMHQLEFVHFLQSEIPFIVSPDASDLEKAVSAFSAVGSNGVESVIAPNGGEYAVTLKNNVKSTSHIKIPEWILLSLRPHARAEAMSFAARVMWKWDKEKTALIFAYSLMGYDAKNNRPQPVDMNFETAADAVREFVREKTALTPFA